jgi:hypothetical protein
MEEQSANNYPLAVLIVRTSQHIKPPPIQKSIKLHNELELVNPYYESFTNCPDKHLVTSYAHLSHIL